MVAFGRMVVDDIENDFDARFVQTFDHLLEFLHLLAGLPACGILIVRRQIADRIVAPIIPQSALHTVFGMKGALSLSLGRPSGLLKKWGKTASFHCTWPSMARAYGSSSSLAGLQRCPSAGAQGPWTRKP